MCARAHARTSRSSGRREEGWAGPAARPDSKAARPLPRGLLGPSTARGLMAAPPPRAPSPAPAAAPREGAVSAAGASFPRAPRPRGKPPRAYLRWASAPHPPGPEQPSTTAKRRENRSRRGAVTPGRGEGRGGGVWGSRARRHRGAPGRGRPRWRHRETFCSPRGSRKERAHRRAAAGPGPAAGLPVSSRPPRHRAEPAVGRAGGEGRRAVGRHGVAAPLSMSPTAVGGRRGVAAWPGVRR